MSRPSDLRALGHDVDSVVSEGLASQPDLVVARAARDTRRVLLTLDKGLGNIRRFPPRLYAGLVVFRLSVKGRAQVRRAVLDALPRSRRSSPRTRWMRTHHRFRMSAHDRSVRGPR